MTDPDAPMPNDSASRFNRGNAMLAKITQGGLAIAIALVVLYGAISSPVFFTLGNFLNVLTSMSLIGIIVIGMTFVLIVGGLADLSVPATIACGAILSLAMQPYVGAVPAALLAIALAGFCGLLNGILIGYLEINPIITTLSVGAIVLGVVQAAVGGVIVYGSDPVMAELVKGRILGIPNVVWVFAAVALLGHYILSRTYWGRWVTAIGGNYTAARASAIPVRAVKSGAFVATGLCAGLSGVLLGLTLQSARPFLGAGYEFSAITAVVIGGISILGGFGSIPRAIAGLIFVQLLTNVMVLEGVRTPPQGFVMGLLIAVAVSLDVALRKRGVA